MDLGVIRMTIKGAIMKLSERLRANLNAPDKEYMDYDKGRLARIISEIEPLESDSELLNGLIEILQRCAFSLDHRVCDGDHEDDCHQEHWEVTAWGKSSRCEGIITASNPRAALEAAVARFKEQKK